MSIAVAIQVLALVAVASASLSSYSYQYKNGNTNFVYGSEVSVVTPSSSFSEHYSYPYTYFTYYSHHKEYIYTYETCSSPPSSIEVCLTSVFSSMESALVSIEGELKLHEATIKYDMHHEHTLLSSEVSFVYEVDIIAESVKSVVNIDYYAVYYQVQDLYIEKELIESAYVNLEVFLGDLEARIDEFESAEVEIYQYYEFVQQAKWSIYSAISAIEYEKGIVEEEVAEVEYIVEQLNIQMQKIAGKISQLNKRQSWLVSWQDKLYADLSGFQEDILHFKQVESDLVKREVSISAHQYYLYEKVEIVEKALMELYADYSEVVYEMDHLKAYLYEIEDVYAYIAEEARIFISAYEEFTCEDSLLYYEACASSASHSSSSSSAVAAS